jgi:hypothetical protein
LSHDIPCNRLSRKTSVFKNLVSSGVIDKFVRKTDFGERGVDLCLAKILAHTGADATDLDAIFNSHNQSVLGRH